MNQRHFDPHLADQPKELQTLYSDAILPDVAISEVESVMAKYVTSFIEPVGWRGIWRASPPSSGLTFKADFLVDVIDVRRNSLEALVIIQKVLDSQLDESNVEASIESGKEIDKLMENNRILNAPLIEMYVVREGDDEQAFLKSAVVIEHARFFYKYIWRPWDTLSNVTQLAEIFVETCLEPRLNLYIDMKQNTVSPSMKTRIKQILADGNNIRRQLDEINKRQELGSESEDFADLALDEVDMFEAIRLKIKLEDLDREMRMFEDPYLRMFTYCLRSTSAEEEECKIEMENSDRVTHVVSKQYDLQTLSLITNFYAKVSHRFNPFRFSFSFKNTTSLTFHAICSISNFSERKRSSKSFAVSQFGQCCN
jgi:arsenate reductase-like glutaredoxin family protein